MIQCPECSQVLPDSAKICTFCGKAIDRRGPGPNDKPLRAWAEDIEGDLKHPAVVAMCLTLIGIGVYNLVFELLGAFYVGLRVEVAVAVVQIYAGIGTLAKWPYGTTGLLVGTWGGIVLNALGLALYGLSMAVLSTAGRLDDLQGPSSWIGLIVALLVAELGLLICALTVIKRRVPQARSMI